MNSFGSDLPFSCARAHRLAFESEVDAIPRPVVVRAHEYPANFRLEMHSHRRAQLAYAVAGTMTVHTEHGIWVVPPQRAVWIPAEVQHYVESTDDVSMRSLFVDPVWAPEMKECCIVAVTPLLRELILHAATLPQLYAIGSPDDHLMTVLLEQLRALPLAPLRLPMPTDRRLAKIAQALLDDPSDKRGLSDWAKTVGASARTISRLFPEETGMSFSAWRQQARLLAALRLLAAAEPVSNVAFDTGFASPSAFVSMFKRSLGKTPGQYFS
jgi:AraC-like DNA-binding protein/mannose-6-phosphate isomerase-like protein (cupin superfamily)